MKNNCTSYFDCICSSSIKWWRYLRWSEIHDIRCDLINLETLESRGWLLRNRYKRGLSKRERNAVLLLQNRWRGTTHGCQWMQRNCLIADETSGFRLYCSYDLQWSYRAESKGYRRSAQPTTLCKMSLFDSNVEKKGASMIDRLRNWM